jgi:hypothetical protein
MNVLESIYTIVGLGVVLFGIVESAATYFLAPTLFRIGIKTKTVQSIDVKFEQLEIGKEYKTSHARFKRISKNSCLFLYRSELFQIYTPFRVKGEVLQSKAGTLLIWRIELIPTIFVFLWLILCVGSLVQNIFQSSLNQLFSMDFASSVLATFFGIFCAWLLYALSAQIEEKRAQLAFSELLFFSLGQ